MITLTQVDFNYDKNTRLFTDLKLELSAGNICGLLGKNGAGKTTLLKILAGLIFPTQGQCEVMAYTPKQREPEFLAEVYFLPEDVFVPALRPKQYANFYAGFYPRFDHDLLKHCLREFELPSDKLLTEFSHGQKKKFLIAFGLATQAKLFILDEPTNGLDIPSKAQFRKLLASTITEEKLFIISTHQVRDVENLIDRVVMLEAGNIIFNQTMNDVNTQLTVIQTPSEPDHKTCLYYEKNLLSYTVLTQQENHSTQIDLELLFNAVLANSQKINTIFAGVNHES